MNNIIVIFTIQSAAPPLYLQCRRVLEVDDKARRQKWFTHPPGTEAGKGGIEMLGIKRTTNGLQSFASEACQPPDHRPSSPLASPSSLLLGQEAVVCAHTQREQKCICVPDTEKVLFYTFVTAPAYASNRSGCSRSRSCEPDLDCPPPVIRSSRCEWVVAHSTRTVGWGHASWPHGSKSEKWNHVHKLA